MTDRGQTLWRGQKRESRQRTDLEDKKNRGQTYDKHDVG